jgi:hypothetical protein
MSPLRTQHILTNPASNIISHWRQLQLNTQAPPSPQQIGCEPAFMNKFGDIPCWIDPATTLRLVTQKVQGIKLLSDDEKLQRSISNMVSLRAGITCLTEMDLEW